MPELKPILLVEDNPKDLELTLAALEQSQLANEVVIVRDGAEALDFLYRRGAHESRNTSDPAVVLLDLKLPKIDGLEVLRRIRGHDSTAALPVVVLTTSNEERDIVDSYRLGANSFVRKPVVFSEFLNAANVLGMYWLLVNEPAPARPGG
jgi:CheY-like chemotaxis protein